MLQTYPPFRGEHIAQTLLQQKTKQKECCTPRSLNPIVWCINVYGLRAYPRFFLQLFLFF